jgi:hypothetical protein
MKCMKNEFFQLTHNLRNKKKMLKKLRDGWYAFLFSPIRGTFPVHLILLDLIILIIFGKEYRRHNTLSSVLLQQSKNSILFLAILSGLNMLVASHPVCNNVSNCISYLRLVTNFYVCHLTTHVQFISAAYVPSLYVLTPVRVPLPYFTVGLSSLFLYVVSNTNT